MCNIVAIFLIELIYLYFIIPSTNVKRSIILLLLLGFVQVLKAQQCTCTIKGVVHEKETHQPIVGAVVYLKGTNLATFTDAKGNYVFRQLCQGNYTLVCQALTFQKVEINFLLEKEHLEDFDLNAADEHIQEVVVTGKKEENTTQTKNTLTGTALDETRGKSLAESMQALVGVSMLQTGSSIAKPVIHGMHSNRVLILNNGIRQEGQQWGSEHAPEIDPFVAQKITLIKGAAGVRYGSDAIAGVIMVEPNPLPDSAKIHAQFNTVAFSNGQQGVVSGIIEGGIKSIKGLAWRMQATYKRGADIQTAHYYLGNTGVQERNFSLALGYQTYHAGVEAFFSYFDTQLGIFAGSHIGNITDLMNAINRSQPSSDYTPSSPSYTINQPNQDLAHHLLKVKSFLISEKLGKFSLTLSRQYDWRLEYDVPRGNRTLNTLNFKLTSYQGELLLDHKPLAGALSGTLGVNALYQYNLSSSYTLEKPLTSTVLIPNYETFNTGVFLIERWTKQKWGLETGLRYDTRYSNVYGLSSGGAIFHQSFTFANASATLGASYQPKESWLMKINAALAWRAPNMNELFSNGVHHGSAAYEKGNIALQPEVAHNLNASVSYQAEKWAFEVAPYFNYIKNFIYLQPRIENGVLQTVLSVRGAFPAFDYTQVDASFVGVDISAKYAFAKRLEWATKYAMVRAKDVLNNRFMVNIPPDRWENTLTYRWSNNTYISFTHSWVAQQTRVESNSDFLPPPPSYQLLSMQASYAFKNIKNLSVGLGMSNMLNVAYRDYMNRFRYFADDMGRNISLRVKYEL